MLKLNTKKNKGYILILTLMILSILVIIVTSMVFKQTAHSALTKTIIDREKSKMLALSGIELAISNLVIAQEKEKKENREIKFLKKIFPYINKWQTVELKDDTDGINGQIKFCITCEDGKININKFYDFNKHKFIGGNPKDKEIDGKKFIQDIMLKVKEYTQKDLFNALQKYLEKRKIPLNDITELLEIPEFNYFQKNLFYEPQVKNEKNKRPIFLTDIFTTWTHSNKLQPWLLSDSVSRLLGLTQAKFDEKWLQKFKINSDWKVDWDQILKPIYGKEFKMLNKQSELIFESQFGPNSFSVVSYGTVGDITQRIFVIMEISISDDKDDSIVKIKKLYWI